jgi:Domain of unknown function (DUF4431)
VDERVPLRHMAWRRLVGLLAGIAVTASAPTVSAACLKYEPDVVQLSGKLERRVYPGRPNYESVQKGDEAETGFYLVLSEPICTDASDPAGINSAQANVRLVQLNLDKAGYDRLRPSLGKEVTVRGTLSAAHTGHHHAPVVLLVEKPAG